MANKSGPGITTKSMTRKRKKNTKPSLGSESGEEVKEEESETPPTWADQIDEEELLFSLRKRAAALKEMKHLCLMELERLEVEESILNTRLEEQIESEKQEQAPSPVVPASPILPSPMDVLSQLRDEINRRK